MSSIHKITSEPDLDDLSDDNLDNGIESAG